MIKAPFVIEDGYITLPGGSGLGVVIDEAYFEARPLGEQSDPGRWFHPDDGSGANR